jgi:hypothetical protein
MVEVSFNRSSEVAELTNTLGFATGTSNNPQINGQYFAENQDVVLVTIK